MSRALWCFCCALLVASVAGGEEIDLQLRASWGGGAPRIWSGSIELSDGVLKKERILGLDADAPASVLPENERTLRILPRSPHAYNGVDINVRGPRESLLRVTIRADGEAAPKKLEAKLGDLISGKATASLDAQNNRLAVQRVPTDMLRFTCERPHLVFRRGETWNCQIEPYRIEEAANASVVLKLTARVIGSASTAYQTEEQLTLDAQGSTAQAKSLQLPLETPGVYELTAEVRTRPLVAPLVRSKPLATRRVQCVVVDAAETTPAEAEWKTIDEFDPVRTQKWDRELRFAHWMVWSGEPKKPLGNEPLGAAEFLGRLWGVLKPGGWQAYPLPIQNPHQPHMLEIEYPNLAPQTLGISIVEPNAAGQVMPLGLDSGIDVGETPPGTQPQMETYRLVFWPRTKSPVLLLTNRHTSRPAAIGPVRVLAGPVALPAAPVEADVLTRERRLVAAYFDKPLFPENFSVPEAVEPRNGRLYDDWTVFATGARRLAEYVGYAGFNAAVVNIQSEGCALYPSQLLDSTPKYDSSPFADTGLDPQRKDVVEVVLREFERRGLICIPALPFASPLAELEALKLHSNGEQAEGLELIGPEGRASTAANAARKDAAPYYNLLDPRVQEAMRRVILEVAQRYRDHASFGGVAIQITADGYAQLPDDTWGLDETTLARFSLETKIALPTADAGSPAARWQWIQKQAPAAWLEWRAEKVAEFYRGVREDLTAVRPDLKLVLCPLEPMGSRRLEQQLHPRLPMPEQTLDELLPTGLDPRRLAKIPGVIWSRVWREDLSFQTDLDPGQTKLNESTALDEAAARSPAPATFTLAEPLPLRLEAFDKVSPFGAGQTTTLLFTQTAPAGPAARRRFTHAIAACDTHLLCDGGWMLPLGQERTVRPLLDTWSRIPATSFETLSPPESGRSQPIIVRRWSSADETWIYLVNDSAWPAIVDVDFQTKQSLNLHTLGLAEPNMQLAARNGQARWRARLAPYDVIAARIDQGHVPVAQWTTQVDSSVEVALREQIRDIKLRANRLRSPVPSVTLRNEGFEEPEKEGTLPGWSRANGAGIVTRIERSQAHSGEAALYLASQSTASAAPPAAAWVRSDPLPTPRTGRLALWVWLKTADAKQQPKIRLAIEGKFEGKTYYRRANVGGSEDGRPTQPLREEWSPFLFPLDDLPVEGLTDLQVGIDLMGEGEVWIDDVQVYDLWFQETERDALLKQIALADFQLQAGKVADCARFLDSYWANFLRRHVPAQMERVAERPKPAAPPTAAVSIPAAKEKSKEPAADSPGFFERFRKWSPRMSSQ